MSKKTTIFSAIAIVVLTIIYLSTLPLSISGDRGIPLPQRPMPPKPKGGIVVKPGDNLQQLLNDYPENTTVILSPGVYRGPITIEKEGVTIWGTEKSIIRGAKGSTVRVIAPKVKLLGFSVEGSGKRFDKLDAAVYIRADHVTAFGLTIREALFGFVVEKSKHLKLISNKIYGLKDTEIGLRGDGIRIWACEHSLLKYNQMYDSRDIVIWYSPHNTLLFNRVYRSRYGTHFMYSSFSTIKNNIYRENIVGIFLMYSNDVTVEENLFYEQRGISGYGIGIKESGNIHIEKNILIDNQIALYMDYSPFSLDQKNVVQNNLFAYSDTAVVFHRSETRNKFSGNSFISNNRQVFVEGRGHALGIQWEGNYFDDYKGYDLNDDGVGDLPYQLYLYSESLIEKKPELAFFRSTPAWYLLDIASRLFWLFPPKKIVEDKKPLYRRPPVPKIFKE